MRNTVRNIAIFTLLTLPLLGDSARSQGLPSHRQNDDSKTTQSVGSKSDHHQVPAIQSEPLRDAQSTPNNSNGKESNSVKHPKSVDTLNAVSTAVIALFTALTFCVFLYQVKVTHDSERAWIVIDSHRKPEHLEWMSVRTDINPHEVFSWTIKNTGRTPARILDIRLRFHYVDNLNHLPFRPDYGNGKCTMLSKIPTDGTIIPQGDTAEIATYFEGTNGEPGAPTQEQMDAVRSQKAFLVACGSVRYKDTFQRKHETRFCSIYNVRMPQHPHVPIEGWFSSGGPERYNKAT